MAKSKTRKTKKHKLTSLSISERNAAARDRSLKVLSAIREGNSLSKAARDNGVSIRTVRRFVGSALVQDRPGARIRATKSDRLVRYMQIPGKDGPREITVRGSKAASEFASYKAAINRLLGGKATALDKWHGRKIQGIELVTDPKVLVQQAQREMLPYTLYRSLAGGAA